MKRLTDITAQIRTPIVRSCHFIETTLLVLDEYPSSPALEEVRATLHRMADAQRVICREYNNLRSLTGTLERERGVSEPRFYVGELRESGLPIGYCNCGLTCSGHRNAAHVPAGQRDLDAHDGHRAQECEYDGEQGSVANVSDDLYGQ